MSLSNQTCGFSLFIGCPLGTSTNVSGVIPEAFAIYNPSLIPANPSFIIKEARNTLIGVVVDSLRGLGRSKRSFRLVHGYSIIRDRQHCAGQCDKHDGTERVWSGSCRNRWHSHHLGFDGYRGRCQEYCQDM